MKSSGIGGQAVIEGVMMKNKDQYAVAVRKPNNEIEIKQDSFHSVSEKIGVLKWPVLRGIAAFVESMILGMKTLTYSADFYEEEEESSSKVETAMGKVFKEKTDNIITGIAVVVAIAAAIGIFIILPYFISQLLSKQIENHAILAVVEGIIRLLIFMGYVLAISQMKDIKRVFMYHGAEHKTINCVEHGYELTVENVRKQSRQHKRCGTSFMLLVMLVSIIFFIFIRVDSPALRVVVRLLLVPVIAGVSYEFIRLAGRSDNYIVNLLSKPGLWLQGMTTKEPDDDMIKVAIASVEAVFDWKNYIEGQRIERLEELEAKKSKNKRPEKTDKEEELLKVIDKKVSAGEAEEETAAGEETVL